MRTSVVKNISNVDGFKNQLLLWANQHSECVVFDSNEKDNVFQKYKSYDLLVAVSAFTALKTDYQNAFNDLHQYQTNTKDWLFGYLSYDLKNDVEPLKSENFDGLEFPVLYFFQPKKLFLLQNNVLEIKYLNFCDEELESDFIEIAKIDNITVSTEIASIEIEQQITREDYLEKVTQILNHIHRGDIYEANFCMEFFAKNTSIDPLVVYQKLNKISSSPFAVYFKNNFQYLLSASPERYLKKIDNKIISQPIKGTAKRSLNIAEDQKLINNLETNTKERSENIMIVDLVRNDLSQTATKGSVFVEELCKVYTFKQVHQLISTIVSEVLHTTSPTEILRTTFPMGSMTGAPKIAAMKIIENLEVTKRGLYSGAVGYFTPFGNFDFNVVIRSILYNQKNNYLSFSVGSAITSQSIPKEEYNECLLKANAMFKVLNKFM